MALTAITAKNLQNLPKGPADILRDRINSLITQAGGELDAATLALFTSADALEEMIAAIASGSGLKGLVAVHKVRGVTTADVPDLNAFTVAGNDGLTYAAGERVLLAAQSTGAQNGIYVVGTVGGGTAPLTRAPDMAAAAVIPTGTLIAVDAGTLYANSLVMITNAGDVTVATTTPTFEFLRALGDGRNVANVANLSTVGGIPVVYPVLIPSGANGDVDVTLPAGHKIRVIGFELALKGAGTAGSTVTLKNAADAISDAIDVSAGGDRDVFRAAEINDAFHEIAGGGTLRLTKASAGADFPGAEAYVHAVRVA